MEERMKELEKDLIALKEELDKLKEELKKAKYKRWRAEIGEEYYSLDDYGESFEFIERDGRIEGFSYKVGNYFKTREEVEKYKERLLIEQKLKDIALRLNAGEKIDWNNSRQLKFYIEIDHIENEINHTGIEIEQETTWSCQNQGTIYCLSQNFFRVVKEEIGEDRLREYLKGE